MTSVTILQYFEISFYGKLTVTVPQICDFLHQQVHRATLLNYSVAIWCLVNDFRIREMQVGILVASVPGAITAAVAMYVSFSIFNPVRNAALKASPVPIRPTLKPETPPPRINDFTFAGKASLGLRRDVAEITIRKIPRI